MRIGTYDELRAAEKKGVTDFTENGKCSGCGECCSDFLPLSPEEISRIRRYVEKHNIRPHHNNVVSIGFDVTCPFRDNVNKVCVIYNIRPAICREFRCDYDPARLTENKDFFHHLYNVVSMRHEFFHEADGFDLLRQELAKSKISNG